MQKILQPLMAEYRRLQRSERGAVAITFAVFSVIAVVLYLFASDLARHNVANTRLQDATDTTALSIASQYRNNPNHLNEDTARYFAANFPQSYLGAKNVNVTALLDEDEGTITVSAKGDFDAWSRFFRPPLSATSVVNFGGSGGGGGGGGFRKAIDYLYVHDTPRYFYNNINLPSDDGSMRLFIGAFKDRCNHGSIYCDVFNMAGDLWHWGVHYDWINEKVSEHNDDKQLHSHITREALGLNEEICSETGKPAPKGSTCANVDRNEQKPITGNDKIALTFKEHSCTSSCPNLPNVN